MAGSKLSENFKRNTEDVTTVNSHGTHAVSKVSLALSCAALASVLLPIVTSWGAHDGGYRAWLMIIAFPACTAAGLVTALIGLRGARTAASSWAVALSSILIAVWVFLFL